MRFPLIILFSVVLFTTPSVIVHAENSPSEKDNSLILQEDPFLKIKSDTAIKPFVFPKSMRVVQSCTATHSCLFHNPGLSLGIYFEDMVGVSLDQMNKIFSDKSRVKKTLLKIDPARIAPVSLGQNMHKPPGGYLFFKKENKKNEVDFILYFRI